MSSQYFEQYLIWNFHSGNDFIFQKSERFPWARYFCDLCEYHYDNLTTCLKVTFPDQFYLLTARLVSEQFIEKSSS